MVAGGVEMVVVGAFYAVYTLDNKYNLRMKSDGLRCRA